MLTHFHPDHVQGLLHLRWVLMETGVADPILDCTYPPSENPRNHNDLTRRPDAAT